MCIYKVFQFAHFSEQKFFIVNIKAAYMVFSIYPSPVILTFICDQILSEITTSMIFDIAKEEGLQDEAYKSPVIDNLRREF